MNRRIKGTFNAWANFAIEDTNFFQRKIAHFIYDMHSVSSKAVQRPIVELGKDTFINQHAIEAIEEGIKFCIKFDSIDFIRWGKQMLCHVWTNTPLFCTVSIFNEHILNRSTNFTAFDWLNHLV